MNRILIVEDNQDMRNAVHNFLSRSGFKVTAVASTEDGIDEIDENSFDLGLIDINLPGKSGYSMIEYIREQGHEIPLIALTARDNIDDKIKGFDLGLTDYIVKPFDLNELLARIRVHLRTVGTVDFSKKIKVGKFEIDPQRMSFMKNGKIMTLTNTEFRIMLFLMSHKSILVDSSDLLDFVWGDHDSAVSRPIRIHIANLRKKIGDDNFQIIRTIPGRGYIFEDSLKAS